MPAVASVEVQKARVSSHSPGCGLISTDGIDTLATNEPGLVLDWVTQPISYGATDFHLTSSDMLFGSTSGSR